jgi:hypothetical protein
VAVLIVVLIMVLLALVVAVVGAPLRARAHERAESSRSLGDVADGGTASEPLIAELHAAREAKYQEIRDAELDYRTGKLSREDFDAVDAGLRAEAIEILDRLQEIEPDVRD